MGRHHVVAEALAELVGQAFGQPAGVDEHQRGAVLGDQGGDAVEHVGQLLRRGHRLQLAVGQLESQVDVALMADIHDGRKRALADQEAADGLDRALGGGQADPQRAPVA